MEKFEDKIDDKLVNTLDEEFEEVRKDIFCPKINGVCVGKKCVAYVKKNKRVRVKGSYQNKDHTTSRFFGDFIRNTTYSYLIFVEYWCSANKQVLFSKNVGNGIYKSEDSYSGSD